MGNHIIRQNLKKRLYHIVILKGKYLKDDENSNNMPLFVKVKGISFNGFEDHIHIKRKNIINDELLKEKRVYYLIGLVIKYRYDDGIENYTLNYVILIEE